MKTILCFGDSNTYGYIPVTAGRFEWGIRWTSLLSDKMQKHGYQMVEEGLCGRTADFDDALGRYGKRGTEILPVALETHRPVDIIILMLGTNDCKSFYGASAETIGAGIEALLKQIESYSNGSKVLLISPIHLGDKVWMDGYDPEFSKQSVEVSKALSDVYEKIAEKHNLNFMKASDFAAPSEEDQEHLDEAGHFSLAEGIYKHLRENML